MNKAKLKSYAPAARRDFIRAVTDRAHLLGLSEQGAEPVDVKGDVAIIGGRPYPAKVAAQRKGLEASIRREGFRPVMEAVAYTWFNRFAALRYMDIGRVTRIVVQAPPDGPEWAAILDRLSRASAVSGDEGQSA